MVRQLTAIMFTDMVGYTALMQEDEGRAHAQRERHREVLMAVVPRHNGEILQHYGAKPSKENRPEEEQYESEFENSSHSYQSI